MLTGDDYFDSKVFKDIFSAYEDSVRSGHYPFMDVDDLTDIADYYNFIGEKAKANDAVEHALELHPGATLPLVFKARQAILENNFAKAFHLADEIVDKEDPDYKYLVAELLIAQKRISEAEEYLKDYFHEIPDEEREDFIMDVANIYIDYSLNGNALDWLSMSRQKNSTDYKELLARTYFGMMMFEECIKLFNELLDRNPYNKNYWTALASAQFMIEDYNASISSCEYAIAIDPDDMEAILAKAGGLYKLDNFEEALVYYQRYCDNTAPDEFALLQLASCLINLGRSNQAITHLEQALASCSNESQYKSQILKELAFSYSQNGQLEKAISHIEQAENIDADKVDTLLLKGHMLLENNHKEQAEEAFRSALRMSSSSPYAMLRVMVSLYDNKYLKAAYDMFKEIEIRIDENHDEGFAYMALCCWDMKNTDEFLYYLDIAVKRNPAEAQRVLSCIFPSNLKAEDYYKYIFDKLNKN